MNKNREVSEIKITYKSKVKPSERIRVINSKTSFEIFQNCFDQDTIEHRESCWALYMNADNKATGTLLISQGGVSATLIDPKIVFQGALMLNATSVIIAHNHPSGNLEASEADLRITKRLREGGRVLDIMFIDHLIISPEGEYLSMMDEGLIPY